MLHQKWGRLDIVVANAGINGVWAPIEELEPEEWDRTLDTNLKGTFLTVKYAVPYLKARGGSVIVTASVNGTRIFSSTGATAYACSKAGQVALAKMLAVELGSPQDPHQRHLPPGPSRPRSTNRWNHGTWNRSALPATYSEGEIPLTHGASGSSGEVAELIWFLASDYSDHITGTEMYIDGGESLVRG